MRTARALLALATTGAIALAFFRACLVYDESLLLRDASPTPEAGEAAASDAGPSCSAARWPERPAADEPGPDEPEMILAIESIQTDPDAGAGTLVGWDMDRTCTCPGAASCVVPDSGPLCDDRSGRDNSAGLLVKQIGTFAGEYFDPTRLNERLRAGEFGLVVRITGYNGKANDTQVTAAAFVSQGMPRNDGGVPVMPKRDGNDAWTIDTRSLFGGTAPPYVPIPDAVDTAAYVRDGFIVASVDSASIEFSAGSGLAALRVTLRAAVVTGRLVKDSVGRWRIEDGILSGRWPARGFLTSLAPVKNPLGSDYLCGDSGAYQALKSLACRSRDIATSPQNDGMGAFCDALSISLGFAAGPAKLGPPAVAAPPFRPCGPQWDDDCN